MLNTRSNKLILAGHLIAVLVVVFGSSACFAQHSNLSQESSGDVINNSNLEPNEIQAKNNLLEDPSNTRVNGEEGAVEDSDASLFGSLFDEDNAISLQPLYTGELFTNTRGGISTNGATKYQGLLDLLITLDLAKTESRLPGKFAMLVQNTHGRGLTEDFIGDSQVISNIDSGDNIMQVSEYWWEFGLLEENVTVRLGKQDLNSEFLVMDLAADFIQSSFGLSPSVGFPSYPNPSMAAVLLAQIRPSLQMKLGVWDAFADGGGWGFSDNDLIYVFTELESKYAVNQGALKGSWDLGYGYVTGGELDGVDRPSGYGVYFQLEQLVYRENPCDDEDDQGFGVFVSYFPKFSSGAIPLSTIDDDFVGGIVYKGLIPGRDADVVGGGVAWAQLNQGGTNQETVVEAFCKLQLSPLFSIQPDLQYIASPSGIYSDALAVGIRFRWSPEIPE